MANISQINGLLINADTASYVLGTRTLAGTQVYRTSSYALTATFANIAFNTSSVQSNIAVVSHSAANRDRIYAREDGLYQVTYHAAVNGNAVCDYVFQVVKNDNTSISGSYTNGKNSSTDITLASAQVLTTLNAGDYITLQTKYSASSGGSVVESSSLNLIKLDGITGPQGPAGTTFPFNGAAIITGSLWVSGSYLGVASGITGSLLGTSSFASFSTNTFTNLKTVRLEMGVSSTTAITTGAKGRKTVSFNGTIVGWRLVADQSTTTTVDVWKANLAIPTVANTITGTAKPALTAAQLAGSTTLTGWTTSVADGDVFILNVDSNNNANYICLELDIVLTNA
jgi:hypothetical protein